MTKEQVLTAIKKNWVSIAFGVLALVAIGVMFFVINPRLEGVQTLVRARAAKAGDIGEMLTKERPNIDVSTTGTRAGDENLSMFPTQQVILDGQKTMDGVIAQSNAVLERAVEVNRRAPLGFDTYEAAAAVYPLDGEQKSVDRDRFRRAYAARVNADNAFNTDAGAYPAGSLQADLGGTRPPTPEELEVLFVALDARLRAQAEIDAAGAEIDQNEFAGLLAKERVLQANALKASRAANHQLYVDANGPSTGLSVHPVAASESPSAEECFNAQLGLWVQETVATNLRRVNEQAASNSAPNERNVLNFPVKHLMSIVVANDIAESSGAATDEGEQGAGFGGLGGAARTGGQGTGQPAGSGTAVRRGGGASRPPAATGDEEPEADAEAESEAGDELPTDAGAEIERQFGVSPSGRPLHTPFYDIAQVTISLRCDAAEVPAVLSQLQRGSFVTVLNVNMSAVDLALAARQGYIYGNRPVAELTLQCEMLFLRPWTGALMPAGIRQGLADAGDAEPEPE